MQSLISHISHTHSCLHTLSLTLPHKHTIYFRVPLFFAGALVICSSIVHWQTHLDHLYHHSKLSTTCVVVYLDRPCAVNTPETLTATFTLTDTQTQKSLLSSSHISLTLTSPPLTNASSTQDLHLPHGISCPILTVIPSSFPLIFLPSFSFSPAEQCRPVRPVQPANLPPWQQCSHSAN